ncbi:MAG: aminoacyl-tRNA hydrolase [Actinomycetota bacterium]
MPAWLVVGLGNPGPGYAETRHNIGARVVERLAERLGTRFRKVRFISVEAAEARLGDQPLYLLRPLVFMNESGPPVTSFLRKRRLETERLVAVHDDIDLAFGALRLKRGGSTAGHRGLESLVRALRTPDFFRVRVGVGRPKGRQDAADHVLDAFSRSEREQAGFLVEDAADAVETLIREGLSPAQDRFNRPAAPGA